MEDSSSGSEKEETNKKNKNTGKKYIFGNFRHHHTLLKAPKSANEPT